MIRAGKIILLIVAALLLQVTLLTSWFESPFRPNLLIGFVVYLGLRENARRWGVLVFALGLLNDCYSGIYPGLTAFSWLLVFFLLQEASGRLYTDSRLLLVMAVFAATVFSAMVDLLLLMLFSAADGIYPSLFAALIPQGLVNSLSALLLMRYMPVLKPTEKAAA